MCTFFGQVGPDILIIFTTLQYASILLSRRVQDPHHAVYRSSFSRGTRFSKLENSQTGSFVSKRYVFHLCVLTNSVWFFRRSGELVDVGLFWRLHELRVCRFDPQEPVWELSNPEKRVLREKLLLYTAW